VGVGQECAKLPKIKDVNHFIKKEEDPTSGFRKTNFAGFPPRSWGWPNRGNRNRGWKPLPQHIYTFPGSKDISSSINLADSAASGWDDPPPARNLSFIT
jgi:hypothetical protein